MCNVWSLLLGHRIIADCVLVRFLQIIFFGLLRRLGYLERKQPNMSAESLCQTLFGGIRRWKRKWNWMKLKYKTLVGLNISLVPHGMSPVPSYILMSSLLNNTNNCSNCNIISFMWMICMFNLAVSAKILFVPWKVKYFCWQRGVDYSPATLCSWSTNGLSEWFFGRVGEHPSASIIRSISKHAHSEEALQIRIKTHGWMEMQKKKIWIIFSHCSLNPAECKYPFEVYSV